MLFVPLLGLDCAMDHWPPIAVATTHLLVCVWVTVVPEEPTILSGSVSVPATGENLTAQV